jgi:hypothetical protein
MKNRALEALRNVVFTQRYHLQVAQEAWDRAIEKIQTNTNQMNVFGVWQADQFQNLLKLHVIIAERDRVVREVTASLEKADPCPVRDKKRAKSLSTKAKRRKA